jgi:hypothetical protein
VRLRVLLALLGAALLSAALVRLPLASLPSYESGLAAGVVSAVLSAWLALERARGRPATPAVRWGLLETTPGEQVLAEASASLQVGAALVALPLFCTLTEGLVAGCRAERGVPPFLLVALPAAFIGGSLGTLAGSLTRSRWRAGLGLAAVVATSTLLCVRELHQGPRHVVHELVLGPISAAAYTGYNAELRFPSSAYAHRAVGLLVALAALALAALVRTWTDHPRADGLEGARHAEPDGWAASRADDLTRAAFLLRHHRRGPAALLGLVGVALLPALAWPDHAGLGSGRSRLQRALPGAISTDRVTLRFAPGSAAHARAAALACEADWAFVQVQSWLGLEPAPSRRVTVWLHPDGETLFQLTGAEGYAFAAPWRREVHATLATDGRVPQLRHEMVHALAGEWCKLPFRVPLSTGLVEGLATALDEGYARSREAHATVAAALDQELLPGASELMSVAGFAQGNMDRSYRASASFVGHLILTGGPEPLRRAYAWGDVGRALHRPLDDLGADWVRFLRTEVAASPAAKARASERFDPSRRPPFFRTACPRVGRAEAPGAVELAPLLAEWEDHDAAGDAYCHAYRVTLEPAHLASAAVQRIRAGRFEDALALTERALASTPPGDSVARLYRQRVLVLARLQRWDEASSALALWRDSGLAAWPEEVSLADLALGDATTREAWAEASLAPPAAAACQWLALLERQPGNAAALDALLALAPDRALAERLLAAAPDLAAQVARRLLHLARSAEARADWGDAETLHARVLELDGLRELQRLEAEDGLGRARHAQGLTPFSSRREKKGV